MIDDCAFTHLLLIFVYINIYYVYYMSNWIESQDIRKTGEEREDEQKSLK